MFRRSLRLLFLVSGWLLVLSGLSYGGLTGYIMWQEYMSPSGQQVLVLKDGRKIPLVQPSPKAVVAAEPLVQPSRAAVVVEEPEPAQAVASIDRRPSTSPMPLPLLPVARIVIPKIAVDRPVVLSENDHLPRFPGVGWLMGSAFPGTPGNLVLFGHLGGPYGTFMRLHELRPGDEFSVFTDAAEYNYRVRASYETTPDDVAVLAPTHAATATLITCSGPWDPIAQTNEGRLIVTAEYIGVSTPAGSSAPIALP